MYYILTCYLLTKGHTTAQELAEKFEVSLRTIYRDIDVLSSAGIPIYVTTGRKGGIHLLDNFMLDKSLFSEIERQEILSGLQSLSAVQYPDVETILNKLGAIFDVLDATAIKQNETGYRVELTLPENQWLYDFLMSFGDNVTIIQPLSLKKKIIKKYEAALNHYKGE